MHLGFVLLLAQGATQAQAPVTRVEVTPARAEIPIGQTLRLSATARDSSGRALPNVPIRWMGHGEGSVDSTGLLKGGYAGYVHVYAMAAADSTKPVLGEAVIRVLPLPASRIQIQPAPSKLLAGTRLTLTGIPFSAQGDRRNDPVSFSSSAPRVASVTPDGRLTAVAPGQATITARSGAARAALSLQVVPNTAARLAVEPALKTVKTGDVVRFKAQAQNAKGRPIADLPVRWAVNAVAAPGVAQVDDQGAFVAETPGKYTVTGFVGDRSADAVIQVEPRRVGRGMVVQGRVPLGFRAAEVWVHPSGKCAYLSTIADRVYAIDVADPSQPRIVDSMLTNARLVNDVMTTEDGRYGVFSREGASDRKNGIVVFDASDPCHPKPVSEYTETVSGGVHSSYVSPGIMSTSPTTPRARCGSSTSGTPPSRRKWRGGRRSRPRPGAMSTTSRLTDGLAYLSLLERRADHPRRRQRHQGRQPASRPSWSRSTSTISTRPMPEWISSTVSVARGTHTAWRHGNYVFVGDEVYASKPAKGLADGNDLTFGRLHVIDVSDLEKPKEVAWYEPTDGGVHNVWVVGRHALPG